jgi:hypothetical protein
VSGFVRLTRPSSGQAAKTNQVVARRLRVASPTTATIAGGLVLALTAAWVPLAGLVRQATVLNIGPAVPIILIYAGVGLVVARRQPRNPVGWILLLFVVLVQLSTVAGYYAVLAYRPGHRGLPLAPAAVLLATAWVPALALFPLVILLFPDGRLTSRRWRWVLWAYAGLFTCVMAVIFGPAVAAVASHHIRLNASGGVITPGHRTGAAARAAEGLVVVSIGVIWLSFVGHQVLSWRRAVGERRQQLKWLAGSATVTLILLTASLAVSSTSVGGEVLTLGIAALPVGIGVGILKYGLYEIDRIISRTLAYAIVTALLIGLYAGLVLLATQVLSVHTPVAVAAATLAAAALFNPLRRRVQQVVDRRFNRARYDADQTIAAFAASLKDTVDLDSVQNDLAAVVHRTLEPSHVSLWISQQG